MALGSQEVGDLVGHVDGLQLEIAAVVQIARLSEHVIHDRSAFLAGRFAPTVNRRIPTSTIHKEVAPESLRENRGEGPMLISNDKIEEVSEKATMEDRSGHECVGADCSAPLLDQSPKVRSHGFKPFADQPCNPNRRGGPTRLEEVLADDELVQGRTRQPLQKEARNESALRRFQGSSRDVGAVPHRLKVGGVRRVGRMGDINDGQQKPPGQANIRREFLLLRVRSRRQPKRPPFGQIQGIPVSR